VGKVEDFMLLFCRFEVIGTSARRHLHSLIGKQSNVAGSVLPGMHQGRCVISDMQPPMLHGGTEGYLGMSSLHCRLQRASHHPVCLNAQGCQWIW